MVSPAKSSTKKSTTAVVKTAAKAPRTTKDNKPKATISSEPSLRFYHSKALRDKTNTVLSALETQPNHAHNGEAIADLVRELVEAGMDYYFLKPLKETHAGFIAEQSARVGIAGAVKLISSISRKFITRMDQAQLQVVATHIRSLAVA